MTWVAVAIGGSAVIGYLASSNAANKAANAQQNAANSANQLQWDMFLRQQENMAPWLQAGKWSLGQMRGGLESGRWTNTMSPMFTMPENWQTDPGYQFTLQQGEQALQRSAAARGGSLGGGTLKALTGYNQGLASNEYGTVYNRLSGAYGDAWNRTNANLTNDYNRYASMAGLGQTAAGSINSTGSNTAYLMGQNLLGAGNAMSANYIAQGNALGNLSNGLGNAWMYYKMFGK